MVFGLERRISFENFEAILVSGCMLALPVSILVSPEWNMGRGLMGFQVLLSTVLFLVIQFLKINWNKPWLSSGIKTTAVFMSLIPFFTSFYFELPILLNRHGIFMTHIRRYYFYALILGLLITAVVALFLIIRKKSIVRWKTFAYPSIIFGISCLWKQIPISAEYGADIFETANTSILIHDFLIMETFQLFSIMVDIC